MIIAPSPAQFRRCQPVDHSPKQFSFLVHPHTTAPRPEAAPWSAISRMNSRWRVPADYRAGVHPLSPAKWRAQRASRGSESALQHLAESCYRALVATMARISRIDKHAVVAQLVRSCRHGWPIRLVRKRRRRKAPDYHHARESKLSEAEQTQTRRQDSARVNHC